MSTADAVRVNQRSPTHVEISRSFRARGAPSSFSSCSAEVMATPFLTWGCGHTVKYDTAKICLAASSNLAARTQAPDHAAAAELPPAPVVVYDGGRRRG